MSLYDRREELEEKCHAASKAAGWWELNGINEELMLIRKLNLIHTELAEATEAHRKDLMSDHLSGVHGVVEELADFVIRFADLAGRGEQNFQFPHKEVMEFGDVSCFKTIEELIGSLTMSVTKLYTETSYRGVKILFGFSLVTIDRNEAMIKDQFGHTVSEVIDLKLAYNASRADHKLENRSKPNGKKY